MSLYISSFTLKTLLSARTARRESIPAVGSENNGVAICRQGGRRLARSDLKDLVGVWCKAGQAGAGRDGGRA